MRKSERWFVLLLWAWAVLSLAGSVTVLAASADGNLLTNPTFQGVENGLPPEGWILRGSVDNGHRVYVVDSDDPDKRAIVFEDHSSAAGAAGEIGFVQDVPAKAGHTYRLTVRGGAVAGAADNRLQAQIRFLPSQAREQVVLRTSSVDGFDEAYVEATAPEGTNMIRVFIYTPASAQPTVRLHSASLVDLDEPSQARGAVVPDARTYIAFLDADSVADPPGAERIQVRTPAQLEAALRAVGPGQIIEVADGEYNIGRPFIIQGKHGTAERPIIIRAQNRGKAVISGNSSFTVNDSSYIVLEGFVFTTNPPRAAISFQNTHHSRITRNRFTLVEEPTGPDAASRHWVTIAGILSEHNRVDHNLFEGKKALGSYIVLGGDNTRMAQHNRIDHNHFKDSLSGTSEVIRIGTSYVSRSDAFAIVEYNLFERINGELEIISVKSGGNHIRFNTFFESEGALTLRHGNGNSVYGNFFIGNGNQRTGGIRVYGADHRIFNNYFEGLGGTDRRAAIALGAGDVENQEEIMNYWPAERTLIAHNTFVNNRVSISVAPESYPFTPRSIRIVNNLIISAPPFPAIDFKRQGDITWENNIIYIDGGTQAAIGFSPQPHEALFVDPKLRMNANGYYIDADSPATDAGLPLEDVTTDLEGKARDAKPDIGAFEWAGYPMLRGPLTPADVGPDAPSLEPVDYTAAGLYLTTLHLDGTLEREGWWGPVAVHVGTTRTGDWNEAVTLTVAVNGESVATINAPDGRFVLNQGELSDGLYELGVIAASGPFSSRKSLVFQVQNLRVIEPLQGQPYARTAPLKLESAWPVESLEKVRIALGDMVVYEGSYAGLPEHIDLTGFDDGVRQLSVTVWNDQGNASHATRNLTVDNFWMVNDPLRPPVDSPWFGTFDYTLTLDTSDGWDYDTSAPQAFHGDSNRRIRTTEAEAWLLWEAPSLVKATVTLYSRLDDVSDRVRFEISDDQMSWRALPYRTHHLGTSEAGWQRLELDAEVAENEKVAFFRLVLAEGKIGEPDVQIGHVLLEGWNEASE